MSISSGLLPGDRPSDRAARQDANLTPVLTAQEFAAQFRDSSRVFWLIAVGIVGDASTAEDVLQDAAIVAMRKLNQFSAGTSFRAWVGTIVRNVALNAQRGDRRRRNAVGDHSKGNGAGRLQEPNTGIPMTPIEELLDSRIATALSGMGDIARACLLLRIVGDLHYAEIARMLEIPEGTAMSHVHRARLYLREKLAPVWSEYAEGTPRE